jgi:hypothetical protein
VKKCNWSKEQIGEIIIDGKTLHLLKDYGHTLLMDALKKKEYGICVQVVPPLMMLKLMLPPTVP